MTAQETIRFEAWARSRGHSIRKEGGRYCEGVVNALRDAWAQAAEAERERICRAIEQEDDHCALGDYMLDSNDCIAVARGAWQRPDYNLTGS